MTEFKKGEWVLISSDPCLINGEKTYAGKKAQVCARVFNTLVTVRIIGTEVRIHVLPSALTHVEPKRKLNVGDVVGYTGTADPFRNGTFRVLEAEYLDFIKVIQVSPTTLMDIATVPLRIPVKDLEVVKRAATGVIPAGEVRIGDEIRISFTMDKIEHTAQAVVSRIDSTSSGRFEFYTGSPSNYFGYGDPHGVNRTITLVKRPEKDPVDARMDKWTVGVIVQVKSDSKPLKTYVNTGESPRGVYQWHEITAGKLSSSTLVPESEVRQAVLDGAKVLGEAA